MKSFKEAGLPERFWNKVAIDAKSGCWLWTASQDLNGYGNYWVSKQKGNRSAHRVCYQALVGAVPEGLQLDHLCRVRQCVNPSHLEAVTSQVNTLRGDLRLRMASKTHCPSEHPYEGENLYLDSKGHRHCKRCRYETNKKRRLNESPEQREKRLATMRGYRTRVQVSA